MPTRVATNRPPAAETEEKLVAVAFGRHRRFLTQDRHGAWAVTLDPKAALAFRSAADAQRAIDDYQRRNLDASLHVDGGEWQPLRMTMKVSFAPA